jgi:hypothetical protein
MEDCKEDRIQQTLPTDAHRADCRMGIEKK